MRLARWLAVVPLGVTGTLAGLLAGMLLWAAADAACPADQQVSGMCVADWYAAATLAAECVGAAIGAFCAVTFASLSAPSHRRAMSLGAMTAGTLYASWFLTADPASLLPPYLIAVSIGAWTTWRVWRRQTPSG